MVNIQNVGTSHNSTKLLISKAFSGLRVHPMFDFVRVFIEKLSLVSENS